MISKIAALALILASNLSFVQTSSANTPPSFPCSYDQMVKNAEMIAKGLIYGIAKEELPPNTVGGLVFAGAVSDGTGQTQFTTIPYSVLNKLGQVIGGGIVTLDGQCNSYAGSIELSKFPLPVISL